MKKATFIIILSSLLFACNDSEIVLPRPEKKISVAGFFNTDSLFIHICENTYMFDYENWDSIVDIENANVTVLENGIPMPNITKKKIERDLYRPGYYYTSSQLPIEGNEYSLQITAPGYPEVKSTTYIPQGIPIDVDSWIVDENYLLVEFKVSFSDPANNENFYMLELRDYSGVVSLYSHVQIYSSDPVIEASLTSSWNQLLFSDKSIDGKNYSLIFRANLNWYAETFTVRLNCLSDDLYKHFLSFEQWYVNYYDGFSEPVLVYQNINGGVGIFAGYSYREFDIQNPFYSPK